MNHQYTGNVATLIALSMGAAAMGQQSNISAGNKFCWAENAGWINWRDAGEPSGSQGVLVGSTFLSGFAFGENIGWINFGDGSPANGTAYANVNGTDFGVNINAGTGALSGYAWGENIGWINFTLPTLPAAQRPRLDMAAQRFRGYAWSENIGWINLDSPDDGKFVGVSNCPADFNVDGVLNSDDLSDYITGYFNQPPDPNCDFNTDGVINADDLGDYITAYFNGC